MKTSMIKAMIGATILMFIFTTGAWADGRGRGNGGHHQRGYRQHGVYQKHPGHHFKQKRYGHYFRHQYRNHPRRHYRLAPRPHRHYRPYYAPYAGNGYGLRFSIMDPYFMFGFSTGGRW